MKLSTLCYLRQNGKTLMLHRNKKAGDYHEGKWNGLGGKFEAGESPEDCMRREVFEESGLEVIKAQLKGFITFPSFDGEDDWYVFVYVVEAWRGELRASAEGSLHWIEDERLFELNLWPGDRVFMEWLEHPPFFSAIFRYKEGKFKDYEVTFY
ncbi:MAG: 8-oxo-dGTP diphosphatase [Deinococcales bacterium]